MMAFDAEWLALREPADALARSAPLTRALAGELAGRPLRVLDLAAGTGSNFRYLADLLPSEQSWLLVDRNPDLLDEAQARIRAWAAGAGYESAIRAARLVLLHDGRMYGIETRRMDLEALTPEPFDGCGLVTASAWLDLVSERWLHDLIGRCGRTRAAILFALTYDGRSSCLPEDDQDEQIRLLVNRHQQIDKGLGAALGPRAARRVRALLAAAGYRVAVARSDWDLAPDMARLQRQLVDGWAAAAAAIAPERSASIEGWRVRRVAHIDRGDSRISVGHEDVAAWR